MRNSRKSEKLNAFILMPFGQEFDDIYNKLIKIPLEEIGFNVNRADSISNQQNILKDIIREIDKADLIVADLTNANTNVFYELGISHTLQRPTILIAQSHDGIPFDLRSYRVIKYSIRFSEAPQLISELRKMGEKVKERKFKYGNPISDFLPKSTSKFLLKKNKEKIDKNDIVYILEKIINTVEKLYLSFEIFANEAKIIREKLENRIEKARKIKQNGSQVKTSEINKFSILIASDINQYAKKIEIEQPRFHDFWESFDENMTSFIQNFQIISKSDHKKAISFIKSTNLLETSIKVNLDIKKDLRKSLDNLMKMDMSRDINYASKRTINVIDKIIFDLEGADSYCRKILILFEEKLKK